MKKKKILLLNDTSLICHHGCNLLMNSIHRLLKKKNFIIQKKIFYEENYLNYTSIVKNFDLILINGEGTIHGKKNSDTIKVDEIIKFIKFVKQNYKIPIVIFNSTIASLKKSHLKTIKLVDKIYVREKYSYNYLKKEKIASSILPDLLSLLVIKNKKNNKGTIVTDSSIEKTTKKLESYANFKKYKFIPILYNNYLRYMRFFIIKFILKFQITYFVNIYLYLKNLYLQKFLSQISKSSFIVTGRFHGIFICLALMKPFYTFKSDTYKIRGLMDMIGIKNRMVNINDINYLKLYKFNKAEILKIKKFKINSKKKFNKFVKELSNLRVAQ
jgi:polysaccharide pyruvyl transferase WcaK-like protein